jgi:hypothetical protein
MTRGADLLASLGDKLACLRGKLTPDAEMDKITWFRAVVRRMCCTSRRMKTTLPLS